MNSLLGYRKKVDLIDRKIAKLILLRFDLAGKIGAYKRKNKIKIADKKRERQIIGNIRKYSGKHQKFAVRIFKEIIGYSKKIQK